MQAPIRLDKWLAQKQISIKMSRVMCNPNMAGQQAPEAMEHFRCRLFKRDRHVDLYLSIVAEAEGVSPYEALFLLAMDGASCRLLEDYEQFKDQWLSELGDSDKMMGTEARSFWKEYTARCSQQRRLRSFLGESVYEEMLHRLEAQSDQPKAV
ncbi:MAG: hypothetical protein MUC41_03490 [Syntrophobacteraceae bacterium]|nr:hypothetical protein [Syntrophobacteraceae bacterium]